MAQQESREQIARDRAIATIDSLGQDLTDSLPQTLKLPRFRAAFLNLAVHNPRIFVCTPESLRSALLKCAHDGLVPDGRLAAIVPYKTKGKLNGKDQWIDVAQYIPMFQGLISRAHELGETFSVTAEVVHQHDQFVVDYSNPQQTSHRPPPLNQDRGPIVGAYAIFRDRRDRVIHREIMDLKELMKTSSISRAKADTSPWKAWPDQMMRKTVIRRGSKYVPMSSEMRDIIDRDDELYDVNLKPEEAEGVDPNYNPLKGRVIEHVQQASAAPSPSAIPEEAGEEDGDPAATAAEPSTAGGGAPAPVDDGANPPAPAQGELLPATPPAESKPAAPQEAPKQEKPVTAEIVQPIKPVARKPDVATRDRWVGLLTAYSDGLAALITVQDVQRLSNSYWNDHGGFPEEGTKAGTYAERIFKTHLTRASGKGSPADADELIKKLQKETAW